MRHAIDLAVKNVASGNGGPFGAVIVRDGKILAEGVNLVTSTCDPTAHAEVVAIRRACQLVGAFELKDCEIYSSCEPCPMCLGALYWARIGHIYFAATREDAAKSGFDDSFIYDEIPLAIAERKIPTECFLQEEGLAAFRAWNESVAKVHY